MASTNLQQFTQTVNAWAATVPRQQVKTAQRKLLLDGWRGVTEKTPVDTGYARFNWQVTFAAPAQGVVGDRPPSRSRGGRAVRQIGEPQAPSVSAASIPDWSVAYITNNVAYIEYLEDGTPRTRAHQMVALTVQELEASFSSSGPAAAVSL
jgi:hypothetical protein